MVPRPVNIHMYVKLGSQSDAISERNSWPSNFLLREHLADSSRRYPSKSDGMKPGETLCWNKFTQKQNITKDQKLLKKYSSMTNT